MQLDQKIFFPQISAMSKIEYNHSNLTHIEWMKMQLPRLDKIDAKPFMFTV